MSELTEFLLARIAEDEAIAREAIALASIYEQSTIKWHWLVSHSRGNRWEPTHHDPARVLRECEAKRRIVGLLEGPEPQFPDWDGGAWASAWDAVEALASIYADHPDYRDEWRP